LPVANQQPRATKSSTGGKKNTGAWNSFFVGDELPGERKYEHIIYRSVEGPVSEFALPVFCSNTS